MGKWRQFEDDVKETGRKLDDEIFEPVKNTVEAIIEDPKKLAAVALAVAFPGAGAFLGAQLGLTGVVGQVVGQTLINTALNGGDVKAAVIGAAIPLVGQEVSSVIGETLGKVGIEGNLNKVIANVATRGLTAEAIGQDPLAAMTLGGVTAGVNAISGQIPGFTDLPVEAQRAINSAITAELTGRDPSQALVNSAISAGIGALQNAASAPAGEQEPNLEDILGPSSPPPAPDPAPVYDFAEPAPEPNLEEILSSPAQPPIADNQPEEQEPTESFYEKNAQRFQDEFNKYLASLEAGESPPPEYGVQDMGITEENWNTYNQHMLDMQARGELPTQWRPGEDGTFTYTGDDGDTLTIGADGNIVGVTDAPPGMLPGENPVAPITPATPTAPVKPVTPVKPPVNPPAQPSRSGPDLTALLALLGGSGQSAPAPVQVAPADVQLMEEIFGTNLFSKDPGGISVADAAAGKRNFSDGGSIDELLQLLRG